ncbi:MAG: hemerythrin family protein [Pseudomonadota bacterium]
MLKAWSDDYSIGIEAIDAQHKGFFEAAHRLYDRILNCEGEMIAEESVAFLRDYANRHFQTEEAFMAEHGYPGLEQHKRLHTEFLEVLDMLVDDLEVFGPSQHLADRALEISQEWLIQHIVDEDAQYAQYVKEQR